MLIFIGFVLIAFAFYALIQWEHHKALKQLEQERDQWRRELQVRASRMRRAAGLSDDA